MSAQQSNLTSMYLKTDIQAFPRLCILSQLLNHCSSQGEPSEVAAQISIQCSQILQAGTFTSHQLTISIFTAKKIGRGFALPSSSPSAWSKLLGEFCFRCKRSGKCCSKWKVHVALTSIQLPTFTPDGYSFPLFSLYKDCTLLYENWMWIALVTILHMLHSTYVTPMLHNQVHVTPYYFCYTVWQRDRKLRQAETVHNLGLTSLSMKELNSFTITCLTISRSATITPGYWPT